MPEPFENCPYCRAYHDRMHVDDDSPPWHEQNHHGFGDVLHVSARAMRIAAKTPPKGRHRSP